MSHRSGLFCGMGKLVTGFKLTSVLLLVLLVMPCHASIQEQGRGVLFGDNHAFAVTAIPGWMLDNQSGVGQGLHMVFYPKGQTWADSPVIIYGRAVSRKYVSSVKAQVEKTVADFHANGSPNYKAVKVKDIRLENGVVAQRYNFSGDQWGNYEAAAYFTQDETINFLVFNARIKSDFDKYLSDFTAIASSYENVYRHPSGHENEKLEALKKEAAAVLDESGGREYETRAVKLAGHTIASSMGQCMGYMKQPQTQQQLFRYYARIDKSGAVTGAYVFPSTSLSVCFSGMMHAVVYPVPPHGRFLLEIEMKTK